MMKFFPTAAALLAPFALAGCMAPVGPVEVTRFHAPEAVARLGMGTIAVEPAPGEPEDSLELSTWRAAVARELQRVGYQTVAPGSGAQVAQVRLRRFVVQPERSGSPVSIGVGGSTGSFGSGVGLGLGFDLSGRPKEQVTTELGVMIRDRAADQTLWEGRANFTVRADAPLAQSQLGAAKMAAALFGDFPGSNGETIEVQ